MLPQSSIASRTRSIALRVMPASHHPAACSDVADGLDRAGRTDRFAPAMRAIVGGELLQFDRDFGLRLVPAFRAELAVAEKAQRAGDAAHLQAFLFQRVEMLADDELGAAAADVDDQAALRRIRHAVGDAEIDQARFFAAGHDFDRMTERLFGRPEKRRRSAQPAHRVGGDGAHAFVRQHAQALAETRQTGQRSVATRLVEACRRARKPAARRTLSRRRSMTRNSPCS